MALIEIKKDPSKTELQWFGPLFLLFWGIIGGLIDWRTDLPFTVTAWIWGIAAGIVVLYSLVPPLRIPIYLGWLYAVFPIGWVVSHTVLALTYYGVLTPIGLCMRALGRDPMRRKLDPDAESYWLKHTPAENVGRYFRQF